MDKPTTERKRLGRKLGSKNLNPPKPRAIQSDFYKKLAALEVGERVYLDGTHDEVRRMASRATVSDARKPKEIHGRKFGTDTYTAICSSNSQNIIYLVRIERLA
jgi:hypothetical protein